MRFPDIHYESEKQTAIERKGIEYEDFVCQEGQEYMIMGQKKLKSGCQKKLAV